ncbi:MAG: hypothetical protein DHS20C01_12570 [marine bacterium B5-7]|nr:MAG: hypothetical protein DHS20C01_12570 [marine bacterium B5-7]
MRVVLIDPRRTATADIVDLHLAPQPGTDLELFNNLLRYLYINNHIDQVYVDTHTLGLENAINAAGDGDPVTIAATRCGIAARDISKFFQWFADNVNAIINCHLLTGRIGKAGAGPFSLTGQPNAMGGREVGGLANQLAAQMDFSSANIDRAKRFWNSENVATDPGLKAVDLFNAIENGRIRVVWIMATNPVVSMPDADRIRSVVVIATPVSKTAS